MIKYMRNVKNENYKELKTHDKHKLCRSYGLEYAERKAEVVEEPEREGLEPPPYDVKIHYKGWIKKEVK